MPEKIRARNERSGPRRGGFLAAAVACASASPARAEPQNLFDAPLSLIASMSRQDVATLTLTIGLICFAVLSTILLLRTRARAAEAEAAARDEMTALRDETERLKTLLLSEHQVLVTWAAASDQPDIIGDVGTILPGERPERVLAFGTWLAPSIARELEDSVSLLRSQGRAFTMTLQSANGQPIEAVGRAIAGRAVLRLREVSGTRADLAELTLRYQNVLATTAALHDLVDALPAPVWMRDEAGLLTFVNTAYVRAVEAKDASDAVDNGIEMFDRTARTELAKARAAGNRFTGRLPAIAAKERRIFDVIDGTCGRGSAGIAVDATDASTMRSELTRMSDAHRRILDQLATGVAIFAADQKLAFYNAAFRSLWELDAGYLDQSPSDSALLDRLRDLNKLPEQQNFKQWKAQLHAAYRSGEANEQMWHLPDGRALRVVIVPHAQGGATYLYDDVTERLDLQRRYEAMIKVQSETLDNLSEAVAVFGSDGRIRLSNPTFERMWKLTHDALAEHPHVDAVAAWCQAQHDDNAMWRTLRGAVTAIDSRQPIGGRFERRDGVAIDWSTMPLPDGATMVTFQDISDSVNVEKALRERNEALETADEIKIDFVHHVSYELRSPLTNIIGFAHFLNDPAFGPLTPRQREYLSYITMSTNSLLAIINNILDLASIDAGAMTLNLSEVDVRGTMEAAAEGIQDRLVKDRIVLHIATAPGIGSFTADASRVRQVLFNLLSNAAGFSPPDSTIEFVAERQPDAIVFRVTDHGPGIPEDVQEKVFDWFETHAQGSQHRGTGLGLSLVRSFVELHGGSVTLESAVGHGTTVTCVFPLTLAAERSAA
ncbi:MAG TPA: ATP-binding protein [Pseudolabrys sp.]|nr:ATP-binding protein [Pseudolabrys sp.]